MRAREEEGTERKGVSRGRRRGKGGGNRCSPFPPSRLLHIRHSRRSRCSFYLFPFEFLFFCPSRIRLPCPDPMGNPLQLLRCFQRRLSRQILLTLRCSCPSLFASSTRPAAPFHLWTVPTATATSCCHFTLKQTRILVV